MSAIRHDAGFTLIDMLLVVALVGILAGIGLPIMNNAIDGMRLGQAAREVEREMQTARLKAVSVNRPMRLRFNCPVNGQYRMVELIGTPSTPDPADSAANRCQETVYPSPAADTNTLTRPNHDGPLRRLPTSVTFGAATSLEFWPDGSVRQQGAGNPWPAVSAAGTAVTLVKAGTVRTITVNSIGKITLVQ